MDIVDLLHREIYLESVAHGHRAPRSVEVMKLALEAIQKLRLNTPNADQDQTHLLQIPQSTDQGPLHDAEISEAPPSSR